MELSNGEQQVQLCLYVTASATIIPIYVLYNILVFHYHS